MPKRGGKATYFPGRRGRSKNFFVSKVNASLALGALGVNTVIAGDLLDLVQDAYLISADLTWAILEHTAGEGSIVVGLNNDVLNVTEIAESLNASPNSQDDRVAIERSNRPVRETGQFSGSQVSEVLNNGNLKRTKLSMVITSARDLQVFALNRSNSPLTTGTVLEVNGKVYGTWK